MVKRDRGKVYRLWSNDGGGGGQFSINLMILFNGTFEIVLLFAKRNYVLNEGNTNFVKTLRKFT